MRQFTLSESTNISETSNCYVIAEAGVNHNGDLGIAKELVHAAKQSGADAVKFQAFIPELLAHSHVPKAGYQLANTGPGSQLSMLEALALPLEKFALLKDEADRIGIDFICTAFDERSLETIYELNPKCLKWPSGEITNIPFIRKAAKLGLPVIVSTGMSNFAEVERAIHEFQSHGANQIAILHCVSAYPAEIKDQNLRAMIKMGDYFEKIVGFSDHTNSQLAALVAIGLGMKIWEKHLTIDKSFNGPDHKASTEPHEFASFIKDIRQAESSLGNGLKQCQASETDTKYIARKSLAYSNSFPSGHIIRPCDLIGIRTSDGIPVELFDLFLGKNLTIDVSALDICTWNQFDD